MRDDRLVDICLPDHARAIEKQQSI